MNSGRILVVVLTILGGCALRPEDVLRSRDFASPGSSLDLSGVDGPSGSLCSIAHAALCDGFETAAFQSPPWYSVEYAGAVSLDATRGYRGSQSLHAHTDPLADSLPRRQAELTEAVIVPLPELYARVFFYLPSPAPTGYVRLLSLLQQDAPNDGPMLWLSDGHLELSTTAPTMTSSSSLLPLDRWVCLEWYVRASTSGEMRFWIDDQEVGDLHVTTNTQTSPPAGRFSIGAAFFGRLDPQPAYDLWWDELVLDSTRVGCER